jgi:hypothetical protein
MVFPMVFEKFHQLVDRGDALGDLMIEEFHSLMKTGAQEKLNALRHGREAFFDVAELELGGAGKVGIYAGVRVNRHADSPLFNLLKSGLYSADFFNIFKKENRYIG